MKHVPREQLVAFLDDELKDSEAQEVSSHLQSCSECAEYLRELQVVDGVLARTPEPEYSEEFDRRVMRELAMLDDAVEEKGALFERLFFGGWVVQGLGAAFATALLVIIPANGQSADEISPNMESVLLAEFTDQVSQVAFSAELPDVDILSDEFSEGA